MIDALNMECQKFLQNHIKPSSDSRTVNILELGVGSGAVINSLQSMMKRDSIIDTDSNVKFYGTDVNPKALDCAERVSKQCNNTVEYVQDSFADSFAGQDAFQNNFDIIIFNPPYVVTSQEELVDAQDKKGIEASWAGGIDGIEVLVNAIPCIEKLLHPELGVFYLLLIEENLKIIR